MRSHFDTLPDGEYDTCPLHGPHKYMPDRRIVVENNRCRLKNNGRFSFTVNDFFEVNILIDKPEA